MRYHEVKQDVLLQVLAIIHKHNADIAFPTQTLKIDPQGFGENHALGEDQSMITSASEGHQ